MAYDDEILAEIETDKYSLAAYNDSQKQFSGIITRSALDPRPDLWRNSKSEHKNPVPPPEDPVTTHRWFKEPIAHAFEDYLHNRIAQDKESSKYHPSPVVTPLTNNIAEFKRCNRSRCYRCKQKGHLRRNCRAPRAACRK
jgi:hypothetical protein